MHKYIYVVKLTVGRGSARVTISVRIWREYRVNKRILYVQTANIDIYVRPSFNCVKEVSVAVFKSMECVTAMVPVFPQLHVGQLHVPKGGVGVGVHTADKGEVARGGVQFETTMYLLTLGSPNPAATHSYIHYIQSTCIYNLPCQIYLFNLINWLNSRYRYYVGSYRVEENLDIPLRGGVDSSGLGTRTFIKHPDQCTHSEQG